MICLEVSPESWAKFWRRMGAMWTLASSDVSPQVESAVYLTYLSLKGES